MTAKQFDDWLVVPRILFAAYFAFAFQVGYWFMGLDVPTAPQAAFVSTVWGTAPAWFGFYVNIRKERSQDAE